MRNPRAWVIFTPLVILLCATSILNAEPQSPEALWADFNHYIRIARADLADAAATALMDRVEDQPLLDIVEAGDYKDYDHTLLRASKMDAVRDTSMKLGGRIQAAKIARARDPERIRADIARLAEGQRANINALERLRAAGQFAAPLMLTTLLDEGQQRLHPWVLSAMVQIGRPMLTPLCAALPDLEPVPMGQVAQVLAEIGYPESMPYLRRVIEDEDTDPNALIIADAAFRKLVEENGPPEQERAASLYLSLGQSYYRSGTEGNQPPGYDQSTQTGVVWEYTTDAGLIAIPVPAAVFPDALAMRSARQALTLDPEMDPALSLWLMANLRRENRLPEGERDLSYASGMQPPTFYLQMAGPLRQHDVLDEALRDHDPALALDAIAGLTATAGAKALVNDTGSIQPLLRALYYPDRRVRFSAAFALGMSRPATGFPSSHRVVPVLSEAVRQTDIRHALVLANEQDTLNQLTASVAELGFQTHSGLSLADVSDQISAGPGIDLIVTQQTVDQVEGLYQQTTADYKLASVPIIAVASPGSQVELHRRMQDNLRMRLTVRPVASESLGSAITQAIESFAGDAIAPDEAALISMTALALLRDIALESGGVFVAGEAEPALIQSLGDARTGVPQEAARVLSLINTPSAQQSIADAALQQARPAAARVSLLESLAESATSYGNHLSQSSLDGLLELVENSHGAIAVAAAKAHGALLLPTSNLVQLIAN